MNEHGIAALKQFVKYDLFDRLADRSRVPDETLVRPGHGNDTTIGAEKPHLQEWIERGW